MTYIVNEMCIKCKFMDCVEVCPVDCFYEGENMLVIHPDECIDCGVCEPECPVEAIRPDTDDGAEEWVEMNRKYADSLAQYHPQGRIPSPTPTTGARSQNKFYRPLLREPGGGYLTARPADASASAEGRFQGSRDLPIAIRRLFLRRPAGSTRIARNRIVGALHRRRYSASMR